MSEKRFTVDDDGIYDTQEKKHFKFIAYDWMECDIYECCEKLNEQQATICKLQEEIKLLKPVNIEQYEQIVQLQEENEQLKEEIELLKQKEEVLNKIWREYLKVQGVR